MSEGYWKGELPRREVLGVKAGNPNATKDEGEKRKFVGGCEAVPDEPKKEGKLPC